MWRHEVYYHSSLSMGIHTRNLTDGGNESIAKIIYTCQRDIDLSVNLLGRYLDAVAV